MGGLADLGRQAGEIIEHGLRRRVEDTVTFQRLVSPRGL